MDLICMQKCKPNAKIHVGMKQSCYQNLLPILAVSTSCVTPAKVLPGTLKVSILNNFGWAKARTIPVMELRGIR